MINKLFAIDLGRDKYCAGDWMGSMDDVVREIGCNVVRGVGKEKRTKENRKNVCQGGWIG